MKLPLSILAVPTLPELRDRTLARLTAAGELALTLLLAAAILLLGWLLARAARAITSGVLRRLHFNEAVRRLGTSGATPARFEPATIAGVVAQWIVIFFSFLVAADSVGLEVTVSVAERLRDVLPRVASAALELSVGVAIAMLLGSLTRRIFETAGSRGSRLRGQVVTAVLTGFAVLLALEQLGFAAQFILALGITAMAAAGLAAALALGLGCRDLARDFIVEYLRSLDEAPRPPR
jgi:hypothetical protein